MRHIELIELGILAADLEKHKMMYSYLYRQPDIIAIPKTEEAVRFIERKKKIDGGNTKLCALRVLRRIN